MNTGTTETPDIKKKNDESIKKFASGLKSEDGN